MEVNPTLKERVDEVCASVQQDYEKEQQVYKKQNELTLDVRTLIYLQELEQQGYCIQDASLSGTSIELYGKNIIRFAFSQLTNSKNSIYQKCHKFEKGDRVCITDKHKFQDVRDADAGVVYSISDKLITL